MGGMCECSAGGAGAGGSLTTSQPVTLNGRRCRAQREACLFQNASSAAREIYVHMLKCASCTVFLLCQMGKKTEFPWAAGRVGQ